MAIQVIPVIKALAPYIAQIAAAAIPAFTSKPEAAKIDPLVERQIEELQAAATQNATSLHTLAEQLQQAIAALEKSAEEARRQAATYKLLVLVALGLSGVSLVSVLYLLVR